MLYLNLLFIILAPACGFLLFIIFAAIYKDVYGRFQASYKVALKLPGDPIHFLIGSLRRLLFLSPEDAFMYVRDMAKLYKQSYRNWAIGGMEFNIIHAKDAEIILSSTKHVNKGKPYNFLYPFLGTGLLTSKGKLWHQRRRILTPAFHFNILQQFHKNFKEETSNFIDNLKSTGTGKDGVTLQNLISRFTLNIVCETAMGVKLSSMKEPDEYRTKMYEIGNAIIHRLMRPWLHFEFLYTITLNRRSILKLLEPVHKFTRSVIKQRRQMFHENKNSLEINENENIYETKKTRYAMLDTLLAAEARGESIDDDGICDEVNTFMMEGHDTTQSSIVFAILLLAHNTDVQVKLLDEINQTLKDNDCDDFLPVHYTSMKYMDRVIKEVLRLYPSVPFISRKISEDLKVDEDITFPKSTIFNIHIYDMHRDPEYFPNPEKFDPDRFLPENCSNRHPYAYIPFSAGPRNCIGQKFALLEVKELLTSLIRNFIFVPITKREEVVFVADLVLRPKTPIKVQFKLR